MRLLQESELSLITGTGRTGVLHVGEAWLAAVALMEGGGPGRQLLLQRPVLVQLVAVSCQHLRTWWKVHSRLQLEHHKPGRRLAVCGCEVSCAARSVPETLTQVGFSCMRVSWVFVVSCANREQPLRCYP